MPDIIVSDEAQPVISYQVPGSTAFLLLAASAVFDGSGLNAPFIPTIEVLAPDGRQILMFGVDLLVTTHAGPFVTFAPHLRATTPGVASPNAYLETAMPELEYSANYTIVFAARTPTSAGVEPAVVVSDMSMLVEVTRGSASHLDYGPFMFVPGPGA
jgi:hypothetical protein